MDVTERTEGDLRRLRDMARRERNRRLHERYRAVILALEGEDAPTIAKTLDRGRRTVQDWVYLYRDGGIEALPPKRQPGRRQKLPPEREDELRARIDGGPAASDRGVCTLRGLDLQRILEQEFGVKYSLQGVYDLLHRLGYSCLAPRPRHEKSDPEKMERFKRHAPLLSASSRTPSVRSAAGCAPG